jgi:hypothetical protein
MSRLRRYQLTVPFFLLAAALAIALEDLGLLWSAFISPSPAPECVPAR